MGEVSPKEGQVRIMNTALCTVIIQLFIEAVVAKISEHDVTRVGVWRTWDYAVLGTYGCTLAQLATIPECIMIDLSVKTARAASGYGECDGTEPPSKATIEAAEGVAARFGLACRYEANEKGWGSFSFFVQEAYDRTNAAHKTVRMEHLMERLAKKGEEGLQRLVILQLVEAGILPRESYVKACIREGQWSSLTEAEADYYGVTLSDYQRKVLSRKAA